LAAGRRSAVQAIRWRCTSPRVVGGHGARNGEAVNFAGATFGVVWAAPLRHRPEPEGRLACRAERAQDGRAMPMTSEPYSKRSPVTRTPWRLMSLLSNCRDAHRQGLVQ